MGWSKPFTISLFCWWNTITNVLFQSTDYLNMKLLVDMVIPLPLCQHHVLSETLLIYPISHWYIRHHERIVPRLDLMLVLCQSRSQFAKISPPTSSQSDCKACAVVYLLLGSTTNSFFIRSVASLDVSPQSDESKWYSPKRILENDSCCDCSWTGYMHFLSWEISMMWCDQWWSHYAWGVETHQIACK